MDTYYLLPIGGIAATIIVGAWAIFLTVRYSRKVGIAYVEDSCLSLIDDITQGIADLEIRFRNSPVSHNLVLLKGYIMNTGKRDISPEMVETQLRLVLPEGFEWIDCQITDHSKDLKIQVATLMAESIEFDFGMLKTKEYFKFDALAMVPIDDRDTEKAAVRSPNIKLRKALRFDFRIVDTHDIQKIRTRDLESSKIFPSKMMQTRSGLPIPRLLRFIPWFNSIFGMSMFTIFIGIASYFLIPLAEGKRISYEIIDPENQSAIVKTVILNTKVKNEQIVLYNREGFRKMMTPKEFDDLHKTTVLQPPDQRFTLFVSLFYIGMGVFIFIMWFIRFVRTRKYRLILRLAEH